MTDNKQKIFILNFSRTFVNVVYQVVFPGIEKMNDQDELSIFLMKPLKVFLDRFKMELYFLYREELARFKKDLDETSLKELLESIISDIKADEYDSKVFSHSCILLSYYAAIAKRNNIPTALKLVTRIIFDAIEHFKKDDEMKEGIIEGIKQSLVKLAEEIIDQKMTNREDNKEDSI